METITIRKKNYKHRNAHTLQWINAYRWSFSVCTNIKMKKKKQNLYVFVCFILLLELIVIHTNISYRIVASNEHDLQWRFIHCSSIDSWVLELLLLLSSCRLFPATEWQYTNIYTTPYTYTYRHVCIVLCYSMYGNIFTSTPTIPSHMTASKWLILYNQIL